MTVRTSIFSTEQQNTSYWQKVNLSQLFIATVTARLLILLDITFLLSLLHTSLFLRYANWIICLDIVFVFTNLYIFYLCFVCKLFELHICVNVELTGKINKNFTETKAKLWKLTKSPSGQMFLHQMLQSIETCRRLPSAVIAYVNIIETVFPRNMFNEEFKNILHVL